MQFIKLKLNYFGSFHNKEIELQPGINVIYGQNEAGKSTIHTFIRGMLFGLERLRGRGASSKEDLYTRYLPWEYPGAFGGSLEITLGERRYLLNRSFHANDKSFTVIDVETGREVKLREGDISELIPGLSEAAYRNTVSIEQRKAQTDAQLAIQLRNYIANLSVTKTKEVDVSKATDTLTAQRKLLETGRFDEQLKALQEEIAEGIAREERLENLSLSLKELQRKEQELQDSQMREMISAGAQENEWIEQYPAILEKYRTYQELCRQSEEMEKSIKELADNLEKSGQGVFSTATLREDIASAEKLQRELTELSRVRSAQQLERDTYQKSAFINKIRFTITLGVIVVIVFYILFHIILVNDILKFSGIFVGFILYIMKDRLQKAKIERLDRNIQEITVTHQKLNADISKILNRYEASTVIELIQKQEDIIRKHYELENSSSKRLEMQLRLEKLEDERDILSETIMKYMLHFLPEEELTESSMRSLKEEIDRRRRMGSEKQAEYHLLMEDVRLRIEKVKWEISTMENNEGELILNKSKYVELEQKRKENALELEAVNLALSTIKDLSVEIHDSFGQSLNQAVSDIIKEVTEHRYTDIKIDEKLDIKVSKNGSYLPIDRLSAGTMEQLYFALRLSVADLLLGKDEMPLIFDDSFALYDDSRVRAALQGLARRRQVLIFTCHTREQTQLEELGINYHLIDLG